MKMSARYILKIIREEVVAHYNMLTEGRLENIKERLPPDLHGALDQIAEADPSGSLKYLAWSARQLKVGENPEEIIDHVGHFHNMLPRLAAAERDINTYQTLADLRAKIEEKGKQSKTQQKREIKDKESSLVYEDDKFIVIRPKTEKASCVYGKNTKWCIAAVVSGNMYDHYSGRNLWFNFIISKDPDAPERFKKIAFPILADSGKIYTQELRDVKDSRLTVQQIQEFMGDSYEPFLRAARQEAMAAGDTPQFKAKAIIEKIRLYSDENMIRNAYKEYLGGDVELPVFVVLAHNEHTPGDVLEQIADRQSTDSSIMGAIVQHPNVPIHVIEEITREPKGIDDYRMQGMYFNYLNKLSGSNRTEYIRKIFELNPDMSGAVFEKVLSHLKTIDELRIAHQHIGDVNVAIKKFIIQNHPVAIEFRKSRQK